MEAQVKAVNVVYFDAVLCRAAPFVAEPDGGFVGTSEPMPVGAEVTVELLEGEGPDAEPKERLKAKVLAVREEVAGGAAPGMRVRFTGAQAEAAPIPRKAQTETKAAPVRADTGPEAEASAAPTADMVDLTERTEVPAHLGQEEAPDAGAVEGGVPGEQAASEESVAASEAESGVFEAADGASGEGAKDGAGEDEGGEDGKKKKKRRRKKSK